RSGDETRTAATEVLENLLVVLGERAPETGAARRSAIVALSTLIGAMTLARIATSSGLSAEILESARDHLCL
ncbi:MAG TPA: hypothetical protein VGM32_14195, partial [Rhodopila sp.]